MDDFERPDLEARFRTRFIAARKRRGITQEDVAKSLHVSQQTVARFENEERGLAANDMPVWADAVGEHWRDLLEEETRPASARELRAQLRAQRKQLEGVRAEAEARDKKAAEMQAELVAFELGSGRQWAAVRWMEANVREIERLLADKER